MQRVVDRVAARTGKPVSLTQRRTGAFQVRWPWAAISVVVTPTSLELEAANTVPAYLWYHLSASVVDLGGVEQTWPGEPPDEPYPAFERPWRQLPLRTRIQQGPLPIVLLFLIALPFVILERIVIVLLWPLIWLRSPSRRRR